MRHALPNALLPVITISGVLLGFVLGGSVAVEQAFGVPGLGRALVTAVIERDIIVVQNLVLLYAVIFVASTSWSTSATRGSTHASGTADGRGRRSGPSEPPASSARRRARAQGRPCAELVRFSRRNTLSAIGGVVGLLIVFVALAAPLLAPARPPQGGLPAHEQAAGRPEPAGHRPGRPRHAEPGDLRRPHLAVRGVLGGILGTTVGSLWGVACGYLRGRFDLVSQRIMEIMQAFPDLILAMAISMAIGTGLQAVIFAIAITRIPFGGRVIRSVALSVREMPYVEAGRASGGSALRIMTFHVLPQCIAPYLVLATTHLGVAIVIEAALGFLGVGVPPPTPTWGNMLADSITALVPPWWLAFFPGLAITVTVLAFNLLGDGIRDTLDPRLSPAFLRMMAGGRKA